MGMSVVHDICLVDKSWIPHKPQFAPTPTLHKTANCFVGFGAFVQWIDRHWVESAGPSVHHVGLESFMIHFQFRATTQ